MDESEEGLIEEYLEKTDEILQSRANAAISVLRYEDAWVFVNDVYQEKGKIVIEFDTFPKVNKKKLKEIEEFILQVDNASGSSDITWFGRIHSILLNGYTSLKERLFS